MATVVISGWEPGFRKVTCTQLLRAYTDLNLAGAKAITDRVLDGETVEVPLASSEQAVELAHQLCVIGANASAIDVPVSSAATDPPVFGELTREPGIIGYEWLRYGVLIEQDETGIFVAEAPGLPGCVSQGRDRAEAMANTEVAITAYLESVAARRESI